MWRVRFRTTICGGLDKLLQWRCWQHPSFPSMKVYMVSANGLEFDLQLDNRNHTETLSTPESVIMERRNSTSRHTDPAPSPGSSSPEPWTDLYKCAWFHSLVWLIYLMSLIIAANILYVFPFGGGSQDLIQDIGYFIVYYAAWFGVDFGIVFLSTVASLSLFKVDDISQLRWKWRAAMLGMRTEQVQRILLIILVLGLAASSAAFGWKTLFSVTFFWQLMVYLFAVAATLCVNRRILGRQTWTEGPQINKEPGTVAFRAQQWWFMVTATFERKETSENMQLPHHAGIISRDDQLLYRDWTAYCRNYLMHHNCYNVQHTHSIAINSNREVSPSTWHNSKSWTSTSSRKHRLHLQERVSTPVQEKAKRYIHPDSRSRSTFPPPRTSLSTFLVSLFSKSSS